MRPSIPPPSPNAHTLVTIRTHNISNARMHMSWQVPYYDYALDMILDIESTDEILSDDQQEMVENDAETLYGLIHARYIVTNRGLHAMLQKYRSCHFGVCPRVLCRGQPVLPIGLSDTLNEESVKLFCPLCENVYNSQLSRHEHIDGAFFGTTFAHLFFLTFPELKPQPIKKGGTYVPRIFGYRIHKDAHRISLDSKKRDKHQSNNRSKATNSAKKDDNSQVKMKE